MMRPNPRNDHTKNSRGFPIFRVFIQASLGQSAPKRRASVKSGSISGLRNLMRSLSKLMDEAVREQGGVVQGFTGDGIMAVFGAPVSFEDAPLRACRAALSILATAQGRRRRSRSQTRRAAAIADRAQHRRGGGRTGCRRVPTPASRFSATR